MSQAVSTEAAGGSVHPAALAKPAPPERWRVGGQTQGSAPSLIRSSPTGTPITEDPPANVAGRSAQKLDPSRPATGKFRGLFLVPDLLCPFSEGFPLASGLESR
ncbi:hypothetical protein SKAU_G00299870 [Synaphobranchus kaupii]|uniref:Uncharacterized protein n=1 Tax=Synaphobranchus kaupii TaxID=118154 RepID=A0A9Q1IMX4_SYNKA|nr:hypothetical protein SKAU_G00299870 [Synaphobranchus kaupii]